jgi:hypothetical protein
MIFDINVENKRIIEIFQNKQLQLFFYFIIMKLSINRRSVTIQLFYKDLISIFLNI